jgi:hypothetical protein
MQELFTDRTRQVLDRAAHEARALDHNYIGTEHLLLGLAESASDPLDTIGVGSVDAIGLVHDIIGPAELRRRTTRSGSRPGPRGSSTSPGRRPGCSATTTSTPGTCCWP